MTIAEQWDEYGGKVLAPDTPPERRALLCAAFYAGALAHERAMLKYPPGDEAANRAALFDEMREYVLGNGPQRGAPLI